MLLKIFLNIIYWQANCLVYLKENCTKYFSQRLSATYNIYVLELREFGSEFCYATPGTIFPEKGQIIDSTIIKGHPTYP